MLFHPGSAGARVDSSGSRRVKHIRIDDSPVAFFKLSKATYGAHVAPRKTSACEIPVNGQAIIQVYKLEDCILDQVGFVR